MNDRERILQPDEALRIEIIVWKLDSDHVERLNVKVSSSAGLSPIKTQEFVLMAVVDALGVIASNTDALARETYAPEDETKQ